MEIISKNEAMSNLRINNLPLLEKEELSLFYEEAYIKMLKRYPPEFFPEKVLRIRQSYLRLVQDQEYWYGFFKD